MAQMYQPSPDAAARQAELDKLITAATARYNALSPREKEMHDWAQRISWVYGEMHLESKGLFADWTKERAARHILTDQVGPDYAERMLADPEFRKIAGLD